MNYIHKHVTATADEWRKYVRLVTSAAKIAGICECVPTEHIDHMRDVLLTEPRTITVGPTPGEWQKHLDEIIAAGVPNDEWLKRVTPHPIVTHCPQCGLQHVDEAEWAFRPHRTHQCQGCMHEWRPFEIPTRGVRAMRDVPLDLIRAELAILKEAIEQGAVLSRRIKDRAGRVRHIDEIVDDLIKLTEGE